MSDSIDKVRDELGLRANPSFWDLILPGLRGKEGQGQSPEEMIEWVREVAQRKGVKLP